MVVLKYKVQNQPYVRMSICEVRSLTKLNHGK